MPIDWGILEPESIGSSRRLQELQLSAAVRHFNNASVPGVGGLWFGMPMMWSALGVDIASRIGASGANAIPVANAIEAAMMNGLLDTQDPRVLGKRRLQNCRSWTFKHLSHRGTYVVQPHRVATVQPLVALGFAEGRRFGSYTLTDEGQALIEDCGYADARDELLAWAHGEEEISDRTRKQLSPIKSLESRARRRLNRALFQGNDPGHTRREKLKRFLEQSQALSFDDETAPVDLDADHWTDLRAGAALIDLRNAAQRVLSLIEEELWRRKNDNKVVTLSLADGAVAAQAALRALRGQAEHLRPRIDAAKNDDSCAFAMDCSATDDQALLVALLKRDGSVTRFADRAAWPGPAFDATRPAERERGGMTDISDAIDEDGSATQTGFAPQLPRLDNLRCLIEELKGNRNPRATGETNS